LAESGISWVKHLEHVQPVFAGRMPCLLSQSDYTGLAQLSKGQI
jgi:hypothetical protein